MTLGFAITGLGWLAMACVPPQWSAVAGLHAVVLQRLEAATIFINSWPFDGP